MLAFFVSHSLLDGVELDVTVVLPARVHAVHLVVLLLAARTI
jgi:hypothetical protein